MALIQRLRQRQGGFGREAKLAVGLALQRRQIKQQGAGLRGGLGFLCDGGFGALNGLHNGFGFGSGPHAVGFFLSVFGVFLPGCVEPLAWIGARRSIKLCMHFPIVAADELANLLFTFHHDCQRRRLHTADSG